ncbi:MAG: hypothetical protein QOF60_2651 [Actinomycetota bacterium]|nr:hypothetical protein [Actinomycetota bacterium]
MCDDYGGNAPQPVAVTHPPPERVEPISRASAVAVLGLDDRPRRSPPFGKEESAIADSRFPNARDADEFPVVLRVAHTPRFRWVAPVVAGLVVLAGAGFGASRLLASDPPPPPAPAPPVTVAPVEVAARAELASTCPPWNAFAAAVPAGERPDPKALGPIVRALHPHLVAAAGAVPYYAAARDEAEYLQGYAGRSAADIQRESVARVQYAVTTVSGACARATASGPA